MKEIKLVNNKGIALVDDEDYELLSKFNWIFSKKDVGYAQVRVYINGKWTTKKMHQLLINATKKFQVDHIDGNGLNNQKFNLRIVTRSQNKMNGNKYKNSSSIFKGVSWCKRDNKWRANIRLNKKLYFLGSFINEIDAAKAYNEKAKELFGKYAKLNEVEK